MLGKEGPVWGLQLCSVHQQLDRDSKKSIVPHRATWGAPHFLCYERSICQWAETTTRFSEGGGLSAVVVGVNSFGVFQRLWTSPFQSGIVQCQRSPIEVCGCILSLIIHLSILCVSPPQPLTFCACMIFLVMNSAFSILSCLHFCLTFSPSSSRLSSLWALIDIFLLTFSLTLTLMCAALSDAQVVWSFIPPHSLLSFIPPGLFIPSSCALKGKLPFTKPLWSYLRDPMTPQSLQ